MDTNSTAVLAIVGTKLSQTIIVTHHFRNIHIGTSHTLQELIDDWQAACQTQWLAIFQSDYTLTKLVARHVCGTLPLDATVEEAVGSAGTRGAPVNTLAPWFAGVVRERTASAGRSHRGRFFVPVPDEMDVTEDVLAGTHVTRVQTYCTALQGLAVDPGASSIKWRLVVHSKKLASVPGTQCQNSSTLVTSLAVQNVLTTQRSRRTRPA